MLFLAQYGGAPGAGAIGEALFFMFCLFLGILLTLGTITLVGLWKVFHRAGHPGWACIIPFYNLYVFTMVAGREWWWMLLCLIPFVGFVFAVILSIDIAKNFGKGIPYGLGLAFLGFIFWPILGFSKAQYINPHDAGLAYRLMPNNSNQ